MHKSGEMCSFFPSATPVWSLFGFKMKKKSRFFLPVNDCQKNARMLKMPINRAFLGGGVGASGDTAPRRRAMEALSLDGSNYRFGRFKVPAILLIVLIIDGKKQKEKAKFARKRENVYLCTP